MGPCMHEMQANCSHGELQWHVGRRLLHLQLSRVSQETEPGNCANTHDDTLTSYTDTTTDFVPHLTRDFI